jgi:hypothetical protein
VRAVVGEQVRRGQQGIDIGAQRTGLTASLIERRRPPIGGGGARGLAQASRLRRRGGREQRSSLALEEHCIEAALAQCRHVGQRCEASVAS